MFLAKSRIIVAAKSFLFGHKQNLLQKVHTFIPSLHAGISKVTNLQKFKSLHDAVDALVECKVNSLPTDLWPPDKYFLTRPKRKIIDEISDQTILLLDNVFLNKSGNASKLIYGEEGIGKSSSLILAVMGAYLAHKNLIPIYVEYVGDGSLYLSPSELISNVLGSPRKLTISECLELLRSRDLFVLLIVDEIEQVYNSMKYEDVRYRILNELTELGSQRTGRAVTFVCGNSSRVPSLITKKAIHDPSQLIEFPILINAPNLNRKKFSPFRVSRGETTGEDIKMIQKHYGLNDEFANSLFFMAGTNLRTIDTIADSVKYSPRTITVLEATLQHLYPSIFDSSSPNIITISHKDLIESLYLNLIKKNYQILSKCNEKLDIILTINWHLEIKPLTALEIRIICDQHTTNILEINKLVDIGLFSAPPDLDYLHAAKPLDLLIYMPIYERRKLSLKNIIFNLIKRDVLFSIIDLKPMITTIVTHLLKANNII